MTDDRPLLSLSEDECWRHIRKASIGRLGVNVGRQPDIFPVNYVFDGDDIVIRTEPGTKLAAAIMGQQVAFEIDAFDGDSHTGWSVVVHGVARESRLLGNVMHDQDLPIETWADGEKTRHLHITPVRITGRMIPGPESRVMTGTVEA